MKYFAIALLVFLSCARQEPDMFMENGKLIVYASRLFDAEPGDTLKIHVQQLYDIADERGILERTQTDSDQCGGTGYCQGTCPDGVTVMLWGWNEQLCACSFAGGVLRVQCIAWGCPMLEIRCSNSPL